MAEKKKEKTKSIRMSEPTWKRLAQMKLDKDKETYEDLLIEFAEKEGY